MQAVLVLDTVGAAVAVAVPEPSEATAQRWRGGIMVAREGMDWLPPYRGPTCSMPVAAEVALTVVDLELWVAEVWVAVEQAQNLQLLMEQQEQQIQVAAAVDVM